MKYTSIFPLALLVSGSTAWATLTLSPIDITSGTGTTASQSTDYGAIYLADIAINGNTVDFTHTAALDPAPSWSANFNRDETFEKVVIHNRDDCCADRLSDITLQILDASNTVLFTSPVLNPANALSGPAFITVDLPSSLTGRQLIVSRDPASIIGGQGVLSIGEVMIGGINDVFIPLGTNLTQAGILAFSAAQAPTSAGPPGGGVAYNAFDGNFGNFTHTNANVNVNATFTTDFGEEMLLESVIMYNRTSCCGERLRDIVVTVLDGTGAEVLNSGILNPLNGLGSPGQIDVDLVALNGGIPIVGKTVVITRIVDNVNTANNADDRSVISLGELQIFGGSVPAPSSDFRIESVVYDSVLSNVTLEWPSKAGFSYQIHESSDLIVWEPTGQPVAAQAGGKTTHTLENVPAPPSFYRIEEILVP